MRPTWLGLAWGAADVGVWGKTWWLGVMGVGWPLYPVQSGRGCAYNPPLCG